MTDLLLLLQLGSAGAAFIAAWFWFQSGRGKAPPDTWEGSALMPDYLNSISRNNRRGATWAGISALLAAITTLITILK